MNHSKDNMKKKKHSQIIELLENKTVMSIKDLAQALGCTEMTVRRNLDELQAMDFVKRERGFVTLLSSARPTEYLEQSKINTKEKIAIAKAALTFIRPGMVVCLDSGTTTQQLAMQLPEDIHLSLITPSLVAAISLANHSQIQLMLPSGQMHHRTRSIILNQPESLTNFTADIAFVSCRAFRVPSGAFEHSMTLCGTKKILASIAAKRILLLDYSKWDISSLCNSVGFDDIEVIITDRKAPADSVRAAVECGKEVLIVNEETSEVEAHYNQPAPPDSGA